MQKVEVKLIEEFILLEKVFGEMEVINEFRGVNGYLEFRENATFWEARDKLMVSMMFE